MFCPECKAEYVVGITRCPDCNVELVDGSPDLEESVPEFVDYREVLSTYSPADVAFLKSYLDNAGIQYFFKGEHFMYVRPLADPVRLMVRTDQFQEAMELLKDVDISFSGISLGREDHEDEP